MDKVSGLSLERPYAEWLAAPAASQQRPCQACHMPEYTGTAAPGAPERQLHRHGFTGVDVPLSPEFTPEEREAVRAEVVALLEGSGSIELAAPDSVQPGAQLDLLVTVTNWIDGHSLPTGTTFVRQLWVEMVARDADQRVLYETGTLDANGDLRGYFSELDPYGDHDLISFSTQLIDDAGTPQLFTWRATEHVQGAIPALHDRTFTLFVPTEGATGPITIDARLRFRTHGPYLLKALGLPELVDEIEIYDLDAVTLSVPLAP